MMGKIGSVKRRLLGIFLSVCLSTVFMPSVAVAASATRVYVSPTLVGDVVGSEFTVDIIIDTPTPIIAWDVRVTVRDLLGRVNSGVIKVKLGGFTPVFAPDGFLPSGGLSVGPQYEADGSEARYAYATTPWQPTSGSGKLARVSFTVVGEGNAVIDIEAWTGGLIDNELQPVTATWEDGVFYNGTYVDTTAPEITVISPTDYGVHPAGPVYIEFSAVDEAGGSGLKSCTASLNGGAPFTSPTTLTLGAGVYDLLVRAEDNAGNVATREIMFVVYDPAAGFVTGGGWINSPLGAYYRDPTLAGMATFSFVSKYEKGATTPTGQTNFQFRIADLNFHSTSYEWLVVSGARAQYKGSGTINGQGNYGFILTAIDGQIVGGGGVDKFRIKIWDKSTGQIVYDNQPGDLDSVDATTDLGGGSIIIHK